CNRSATRPTCRVSARRRENRRLRPRRRTGLHRSGWVGASELLGCHGKLYGLPYSPSMFAWIITGYPPADTESVDHPVTPGQLRTPPCGAEPTPRRRAMPTLPTL